MKLNERPWLKMFSEKRKGDIKKFVSTIMHDDHDSNYFICYYAEGSMHSFRTTIIFIFAKTSI